MVIYGRELEKVLVTNGENVGESTIKRTGTAPHPPRDYAALLGRLPRQGHISGRGPYLQRNPKYEGALERSRQLRDLAVSVGVSVTAGG